MRKIISAFLLLAFIFTIFTGCNNRSTENNSTDGSGKISIVATIFPPYDFARGIVGEKADLTMMIDPGAEVHSYDPLPTDIIKIQECDVFIYIGGESDAWVDTILESIDTTNKKIVKLMDFVIPVTEETVEGMEGTDESETEDEYDEHIWTSPKNAIAIVNALSTVICEADPNNADTYAANTTNYTGKIQEINDEIQSIVDSAENNLIVFGDRFPMRYFTEQFGLEYRAAFSGCSAESEASAGTLAYLIDLVNEKKLPYIYYIELSNQVVAKAICEQTGAEMLLLHSCQNVTKDEFETDATYVSIMSQNAENLRKGLTQ